MIQIDCLRYRPCGACGELVPTDSGCKHWKGAGSKVSVPGARVRVTRPSSMDLTARQAGV